MSGIKFRDPGNSAWTDLATCSAVKLRNATNTGWIDKSALRWDIRARDTANAHWLSIVGNDPYKLTLAHDDLDFMYSPTIPDVPSGSTVRLEFDLNLGNFFSLVGLGGHIPFGVNMIVGTDYLHCGPIIRNGQNIFTHARGFLLATPATCSSFAGGTVNDGVLGEYWHTETTSPPYSGTTDPGYNLNMVTKTGGVSNFDPTNYSSIHVRVDGWLHGTTYSDQIFITIRNNADNSLLYSGYGASGINWFHTATYQGFIGAIGPHFVGPTSGNGCVEPDGPAPGGTPTAYAVVSNIYQACY